MIKTIEIKNTKRQCPACGSLSAQCLGSMSTLMAANPYYDEDGVYQFNDPNTITSSYKCMRCGQSYDMVSDRGVEILRYTPLSELPGEESPVVPEDVTLKGECVIQYDGGKAKATELPQCSGSLTLPLVTEMYQTISMNCNIPFRLVYDDKEYIINKEAMERIVTFLKTFGLLEVKYSE